MTKKTGNILKEVLENINPPKEIVLEFDKSLKSFLEEIKKRIKKSKLNMKVFVGGSFAKKTLIKKDFYDADVFFRFDKKHNGDISELTKKLLKGLKFTVVHGSRDYFQIKVRPNFFIEIIPVLKAKNPEEAENITDLSYSHVKYINGKIKSNKILEQIKLAKAFCQANNCYGAESYINGFSGYSLELALYYYKSFEKFLKEMIKVKDKLVIDIEKDYKNKSQVLMDLNSSKLDSPVILIDPTYKHRNALAALSLETFEKFQDVAKKFLKFPNIKYFEKQKIDLEKIKENAKKNKNEFVLLEASTSKQQGDVAGSKLLKFYKHFESELKKFFEVKNNGFNYNHKKSARFFFVGKAKKEIIFGGPFVNDKENVKAFKKEHKKTFTKNKRLFAKEKINLSLDSFIKKWKIKNKKLIKEMYITKLDIV
jgi:tRNA nucleotidyltransferase (CCA-adding enzyme)